MQKIGSNQDLILVGLDGKARFIHCGKPYDTELLGDGETPIDAANELRMLLIAKHPTINFIRFLEVFVELPDGDLKLVKEKA